MQDIKVGATLQSVLNAGNTSVGKDILMSSNAAVKWYGPTKYCNIKSYGAIDGSMLIQVNNEAITSIMIDATGRVNLGVAGTISNSASLAASSTTTDKGWLFPRMTNAQMNAISSPAEGLQVYDTTNHVLCFYNGTVWKVIATV